jgi:hypothetical protein
MSSQIIPLKGRPDFLESSRILRAANTVIEAIGRGLTEAHCAAVFGQKCRTPQGSTQDRGERYVFGEVRVAALALLTFTALPGWRSCGVVIAKFSAHAVNLRSSPTVFADGDTLGLRPRNLWAAPEVPVFRADARLIHQPRTPDSEKARSLGSRARSRAGPHTCL